jgi:hypothetical protein
VWITIKTEDGTIRVSPDQIASIEDVADERDIVTLALPAGCLPGTKPTKGKLYSIELYGAEAQALRNHIGLGRKLP